MMFRVLAADFLKIRRKAIWFLIFLGPIGVIALQAANYGLRYDYLMEKYAANLWGAFLGNIQFLLPVTILLGIAIIASMVANIEHQMNSWKQLLALPITRTAVFSAKFTLCVLMLLVSCILLGIGIVGLGLGLKLGTDVPLISVIKLSFYPFIASFPALALQLWLSVTMRNQALPLTVGILGGVVSTYASDMPDWFLWKLPLLTNKAGIPEYSVVAGLAVGIVIFILGRIHFTRRDVN
ncbi:ABC transporter permease [Paenibacillus tyrfis]|uniref:ABC transporter permease n=1 Tax=Paenibacillus tyrfis TaxID=1501230 RepID=UPI0020A07157|nr:ABC transporter permease [Paenibacillus tyrfis]MCP1306893.1 ABC transporter permease [Paenibacillus tyrfis]